MKKIIALLPLLLLFSCMKSSVYSEMFRDFDDNRWMKNDNWTFDFEIEEDTKASIIVNFSHVYEPMYNEVPIVVTIKNPSGEEEVIAVSMLLKDGEGNDISDCTGDICDLEYILKEGYDFKKGAYKITMANAFKHTYLPNVLGVGITIEMTEK